MITRRPRVDPGTALVRGEDPFSRRANPPEGGGAKPRIGASCPDSRAAEGRGDLQRHRDLAGRGPMFVKTRGRTWISWLLVTVTAVAGRPPLPAPSSSPSPRVSRTISSGRCSPRPPTGWARSPFRIRPHSTATNWGAPCSSSRLRCSFTSEDGGTRRLVPGGGGRCGPPGWPRGMRRSPSSASPFRASSLESTLPQRPRRGVRFWGFSVEDSWRPASG